MMIRYENGLTVEGILLAAGDQRMRVAVASERDTLELVKAGNSWHTEGGDAIEIEALIPIPGTDVSRLCGTAQPRTLAAGGSRTDF
jgi:hypothetical protein